MCHKIWKGNEVCRGREKFENHCIILWDEIYIKPVLTCHGRKLFGRAIDHSEKLAKTMLMVMIKCSDGGPKFIYKVYHISNLTAKFLYDEGQSIEKQSNLNKKTKSLLLL